MGTGDQQNPFISSVGPAAGLKLLPNWPRGMSVETASSYVGVSRTKFLEEVDEGIWPKPDRRGGRLVWDRRLLDQAFDRRSHIDAGSIDAMAMLEALE